METLEQTVVLGQDDVFATIGIDPNAWMSRDWALLADLSFVDVNACAAGRSIMTLNVRGVEALHAACVIPARLRRDVA